ncbi:MAG: flagellar basal body-associated FliL family protein [candidate division Zixibacteria bacterium]
MPDAVNEIEKMDTETDSEDVSEESSPPSTSGSGGPKKLIIMLVGMQLLMASAAFAFVKFYISPKIQHAYEAPLEESTARERGEIHLIENILVNPAGTNGTRFLSTSIGIETPKSGEEGGGHGEGGGTGDFEAAGPIIRDILIAVLSSKTMEELSSVDGKTQLREEILIKLNEAVAPDSIYNVYFVDYVLQ